MEGLIHKGGGGGLIFRILRYIVVRFKFLVASLYNVNDAAHSMVQSITFDCLKILVTEFGINLEVNWLCLCDLAHFL